MFSAPWWIKPALLDSLLISFQRAHFPMHLCFKVALYCDLTFNNEHFVDKKYYTCI